MSPVNELNFNIKQCFEDIVFFKVCNSRISSMFHLYVKNNFHDMRAFGSLRRGDWDVHVIQEKVLHGNQIAIPFLTQHIY